MEEFMTLCNEIQSCGFSHCILDLKIHGLVLHRGMHWQLVWQIPTYAARSIGRRQLLKKHIVKLLRK